MVAISRKSKLYIAYMVSDFGTNWEHGSEQESRTIGSSRPWKHVGLSDLGKAFGWRALRSKLENRLIQTLARPVEQLHHIAQRRRNGKNVQGASDANC